MLTPHEIVALSKAGKPLPQERERNVPESEVGDIGKAAQDILMSFSSSVQSAKFEQSVNITMQKIRKLGRKHGRYPALGILCVHWAQHTPGVDLNLVPDVRGETPPDEESLVKAFQWAAQIKNEEGAWTIPLAMLCSADRETSYMAAMRIMTVACVGLYLAVQRENGNSG